MLHLTVLTPEALKGITGDKVGHGGAVPIDIFGKSNQRMADQQTDRYSQDEIDTS